MITVIVIGATQNTFSQSLLQVDSLTKNATVLNKNHLRAAKDHFEQALRLDKNNEVARSFVEELRPQFNSHGIKVSILDSAGAIESVERDGGVQRANSANSGSDKESEPSWARSDGDDDGDDDDDDDTSATRLSTREGVPELGLLPRSSRETFLSDDLVRLSVGNDSAHEEPVPSSGLDSRRGQSSRSLAVRSHRSNHFVPGSRQTGIAVTAPFPDASEQPSATRSPRNSRSISLSRHKTPNHLVSASTRRKSFADIDRDASPELVDDTVYIDDESTDYGHGSSDGPASPLDVTRRFARSSIGGRSSVSMDSDSTSPLGERISFEESSDLEMDMDAEWAQ